jgi:hypothetical protein
MSSVAATERAISFVQSPENMKGHQHTAGFLFLYELFTRTTKCRLAGGSAHMYAVLLLQTYEDTHSGGMLGSILHTLAYNPAICADPRLKFKDTRRTKSSEICTMPTEQEKNTPLNDL